MRLLVPKTLTGVHLEGALATALLVLTVTSLTQDKRAYIPGLLAGIGATMIGMFWHWADRRHSPDIRRSLSEPLAVRALRSLAAIPLLAGSLWLVATNFNQAGPHPCLCFGSNQGDNLYDLQNLSAGACAESFLVSVALRLIIVCFLQLPATPSAEQ